MSNDTVAWFEVATDDAKNAEEFYGELFGWTFASDPNSAAAGMDYRLITYRGAEGPAGGLMVTGGRFPNHAVFYVQVADVNEACARAEKLGGTVVQSSPDSPTPFAYLKDRSGNQFAIFTPAAP
jgi:predicted enzyme related to lactoylglutathione lyase